MSFRSLTGGVVAAALLFAGPAFAQGAKDPVVAKVNGVEIHQSDLDVIEPEAGQIPPMSENAKKDYLVSFATDLILVSKGAQDQKMGDTPDFAGGVWGSVRQKRPMAIDVPAAR